MDERAPRIALWAWLGTSALLGYWFAWVAVSALFHVGSNPSGETVFVASGAGSTVYPFTYLAVAMAFVGLSYFVIRQEGRSRGSYLLGPLVAYVGCVGMINLYEQVYLLGALSSTRSTYWLSRDWGAPPVAIFSFLGLTWVLASAPWWHRQNLSLAVPLIALFVVSMAIWIGLGFPSVSAGVGWVYALNSVSRIASELIPVALATPPQLSARIYAHLPRLGRLAGRFGAPH